MYVIGTAGHVDHGKSTLVTWLTGIDPDRLREEKERGLTIDLGFAWLTLPSGREVSIVDVPGHQRFVKNMLAGAAGFDLAMLVVAADEGVREQTREHLAILDVLGVRSVVIVLTKGDKADAELVKLVAEETREFIDTTRFAGAPMVAVSATANSGMDPLLAALDAALDALPERLDLDRPRLWVDRVFAMRGFGTVVTGTLVEGMLEVGQEVEFQPGALTGRIRGLQRHGRSAEQLLPGTRAAVNISGLDSDQLKRGMVLARPGAMRPVSLVAVRLQGLPTLAGRLKTGMGVTFLAGSAETEAHLRLLESTEMRAGEKTWAIVRLRQAVPVQTGDRCVVRTANETVAGGLIVMLDPPVRRLRAGALGILLSARLAASPAATVLAQLEEGPLTREALGLVSGVTGATLEDAIALLREDGTVEEVGGTLFALAWLDSQVEAGIASVGAALADRPLRSAVPQEQVRSRMRLDATAFRAVLSRALVSGRVEARVNGTLTLPGYVVRLSAAQEREVGEFLRLLHSSRFATLGGFSDPELANYAAESAEDLGGGVVADRQAFAEMLQHTAEYLRIHGTITLAEARDLLGTNRKFTQAFLERLDARNVTLRTGDSRLLRDDYREHS